MVDYNNFNSHPHHTRRLVYGNNDFLLNGSDDGEDDDDESEIYHGHSQNVSETHKLIPLSSDIMMTSVGQIKYHGIGRNTSKRYTSWAIIICTILFMLLLVYIPILQNVQSPRIGELDDNNIDCNNEKYIEICMSSKRTGIFLYFIFFFVVM